MIRNAAIAVSSLAAAATTGLWVAGQVSVLELSRDFDADTSIMLLIHDGHFRMLYTATVDSRFEIDVGEALGHVAPGTMYVEHRFLGGRIESLLRTTGGASTRRQVRQACLDIPMWWPLAAFGALPTWTFLRGPVRRWRRRRKGWCLGCGYDLRGNVSGVCSECGSNVPGAAQSATDAPNTATTAPNGRIDPQKCLKRVP